MYQERTVRGTDGPCLDLISDAYFCQSSSCQFGFETESRKSGVDIVQHVEEPVNNTSLASDWRA